MIGWDVLIVSGDFDSFDFQISRFSNFSVSQDLLLEILNRIRNKLFNLVFNMAFPPTVDPSNRMRFLKVIQSPHGVKPGENGTSNLQKNIITRSDGDFEWSYHPWAEILRMSEKHFYWFIMKLVKNGHIDSKLAWVIIHIASCDYGLELVMSALGYKKTSGSPIDIAITQHSKLIMDECRVFLRQLLDGDVVNCTVSVCQNWLAEDAPASALIKPRSFTNWATYKLAIKSLLLDREVHWLYNNVKDENIIDGIVTNLVYSQISAQGCILMRGLNLLYKITDGTTGTVRCIGKNNYDTAKGIHEIAQRLIQEKKDAGVTSSGGGGGGGGSNSSSSNPVILLECPFISKSSGIRHFFRADGTFHETTLNKWRKNKTSTAMGKKNMARHMKNIVLNHGDNATLMTLLESFSKVHPEHFEMFVSAKKIIATEAAQAFAHATTQAEQLQQTRTDGMNDQVLEMLALHKSNASAGETKEEPVVTSFASREKRMENSEANDEPLTTRMKKNGLLSTDCDFPKGALLSCLEKYQIELYTHILKSDEKTGKLVNEADFRAYIMSGSELFGDGSHSQGQGVGNRIFSSGIQKHWNRLRETHGWISEAQYLHMKEAASKEEGDGDGDGDVVME